MSSQCRVHRSVRVVESIGIFWWNILVLADIGWLRRVLRLESVAETPARIEDTTKITSAPSKFVVAFTFRSHLLRVERSSQVDTKVTNDICA